MLKICNCLKGVRQRFRLCPVNCFLLLSALWLWLIGVPGIVSAQVVDIPDPGLRAAIAEALHKAPGDAITRADMETLGELQAGGRGITDLRGIEFAINLTELNLWYNEISGILPLASLTNLTALFLEGNLLSDISPLASLANLDVLDLGHNEIRDISPLASLTNLTTLFLWGNSITDISPLSSLTNLTWLHLGSNSITDISPLANLTNLRDLGLEENTITDTSPLANLTNLRGLFLWSNSITDISSLANLTNLRDLDLEENTIRDISSLASLTNLTALSLKDNNISDIFALIPLKNLTWLHLGYNNISDVFALIPLKNLTRLHLEHNNISDVETLERLMAQGTVVYFRGNPAFEIPGPKIEDGWVGLVVPATNVRSGSQAAGSGRDFLSEASGGAVTETDIAVNGAQAGTRVGDSVWTSGTLDATDPNNLNTAVGYLGLTDIRYPVAYGVVPIRSETQQETRVYIGAGPCKSLAQRDVGLQRYPSLVGRQLRNGCACHANTGRESAVCRRL